MGSSAQDYSYSDKATREQKRNLKQERRAAIAAQAAERREALAAKRAWSEPVPRLGSTVIIASVTFKLAEVKSGELIWKATRDLDLEFKSRAGESVEESRGQIAAIGRHGSDLVHD